MDLLRSEIKGLLRLPAIPISDDVIHARIRRLLWALTISASEEPTPAAAYIHTRMECLERLSQLFEDSALGKKISEDISDSGCSDLRAIWFCNCIEQALDKGRSDISDGLYMMLGMTIHYSSSVRLRHATYVGVGYLGRMPGFRESRCFTDEKRAEIARAIDKRLEGKRGKIRSVCGNLAESQKFKNKKGGFLTAEAIRSIYKNSKK